MGTSRTRIRAHFCRATLEPLKGKLQPGEGALFRQVYAKSVGLVGNDQVRSKLVARVDADVFGQHHSHGVRRGHKAAVAEEIHAVDVPLNKDPR